jgi:pimeloyl-ACP methyl ester carboxylesterase
MGEVAVGDARIAYDVQGDADGTPLVLIHGTAQDRLGWATVLPAIGSGYRVVLPELRGSGQTRDGGGPLDVDALAGDVLAVVDDAGVTGAFHLCGYSLGAVVAAAVAATVGDRVRSLVLLCGWAESDAHIRFELDLWRRLLETDAALFLRHGFSHGFTPAWFDAVGDAAGMMADTAASMIDASGGARQADLDTRVDIAGRLGDITAPTLVLGATGDRFIPFHHSEQLAKAIAGARLEAIDAGHLCILERGDEVGARIREHLESN